LVLVSERQSQTMKKLNFISFLFYAFWNRAFREGQCSDWCAKGALQSTCCGST
jgi:hypothetical protein